MMYFLFVGIVLLLGAHLLEEDKGSWVTNDEITVDGLFGCVMAGILGLPYL